MALREVVDDDGQAWLVYAIVPDTYDDRIGFAEGYGRGWLCFQSVEEKWRYLGIPPGWDAFGDTELLDLMNEAIRVPPRHDGSGMS